MESGRCLRRSVVRTVKSIPLSALGLCAALILFGCNEDNSTGTHSGNRLI